MASQVIDLHKLQLPAAFRWKEPMTDDEFIAFSERNKPFLFERNREGEIVVMTVGGIGGLNEQLITSALFAWNAQTGTGKVFSSNTGFNLPDGSCLSPDACWVSNVRWKALTKQEQTGFPPFCPEFVVELLSPSDSRKRLEIKMERWMENGAMLAWLVDPFAREVVVYRAGEPTETLESPEVVLGHPPIEGFVIQMTPLWQSE